MLLDWIVGVIFCLLNHHALAQTGPPVEILDTRTTTTCTSGEQCKSITDSACKPLIEAFSNGELTRAELGAKHCGNPKKFCCKVKQEAIDIRATDSQTCNSGSECILLRSCDELISQFRTGQISRTELKSLQCEGSNNVCCPIKEPTRSSGSTGLDSPSYLPSAEKGECGDLYDPSNIVGGNTTKPGRYPFVAIIGVVEGSKINYKCGGSIINKWYILSAAHCFRNTGLERGKVNVGDWKISTPDDCTSENYCLPQNQIINIDKVTIHESYVQTRTKVDYDIALVKLEKMMKYEPTVQPVCLPFDSFDLDVLRISDFQNSIIGIRAHAIGWGTSAPGAGPLEFAATNSKVSTDEQQFVDLPINTESKCQASWPTVTYERQVCAGGESGKDSCKGDSGGPLVISKFHPRLKNLTPDFDGSKWYLVGLTSYGSSNCGSGKPGVYTRVTEFESWIKRNMK